MDLPNNIITHFLKQVYFVSGCACGGKTTIARYLAEKYQMTLYNWDERFSQHKAISDPTYQPAMNATFRSWEDYFGRPPREYAEAIRASIREQVEIAIIELLSLSTNGSIIVDGIFPVSVLKQISSKDRVVFLMADMPTIRQDFFTREDKHDMLACINRLRNPQQATENMFRSIEYFLASDFNDIKASGFRWFHRGEHPNWEAIRADIEQHFKLGSVH